MLVTTKHHRAPLPSHRCRPTWTNLRSSFICLKVQSPLHHGVPPGVPPPPSSDYFPPKTEKTHSELSAEFFRPKGFWVFAGEERILIWAVPIQLGITELTESYWFQGHGLKSNNTFLFIMFAVPCVGCHMVDAARVCSFVKLKPLMERPLSIIKGSSTVAFLSDSCCHGQRANETCLAGD